MTSETQTNQRLPVSRSLVLSQVCVNMCQDLWSTFTPLPRQCQGSWQVTNQFQKRTSVTWHNQPITNKFLEFKRAWMPQVQARSFINSLDYREDLECRHWEQGIMGNRPSRSLQDIRRQREKNQKQLKWLCQQLRVLTEQYELWKVRQDRATNSPLFMYNLEMKMDILKRLMWLIYDRAEEMADEVLAQRMMEAMMDIRIEWRAQILHVIEWQK